MAAVLLSGASLRLSQVKRYSFEAKSASEPPLSCPQAVRKAHMQSAGNLARTPRNEQSRTAAEQVSLARLVMNAELSQAHQCRIIVPTLYRESYLDCLRVLTREGDARAFIKAMTDIQRWTASFDYNSLDDVISLMNRCNAFEKSLVDFKLLEPAKLNS